MVWNKTVNVDSGYLKPLNDTKFHCCKTMQDNLEELGEGYYRTMMRIKYCPWCGTKTSINYVFE